MRIQHVGLVVSDLERSRRFYADALGLEEVPRPANFAFDGAWFQVGEEPRLLHLLVETDTTSSAGGADPGPSASVGLANHVALEVGSTSTTRASGSMSTASG